MTKTDKANIWKLGVIAIIKAPIISNKKAIINVLFLPNRSAIAPVGISARVVVNMKIVSIIPIPA